VKSEYRSRGIGSRIIEYFTKAMKDSGVIGLELDSGFARERAHKFYEAEGFKKVSFLLSRRI
jgi:GNAT superfamily N-acetyltransferase